MGRRIALPADLLPADLLPAYREPQPVVPELLRPDLECRFARHCACLGQHVSSMHFLDGRQLCCAPPYFEVQMHAVLHEQTEPAQERHVVRDELGDDLRLGVELRCGAVRLVLDGLILRVATSRLQVVTLGLEVRAILVGDFQRRLCTSSILMHYTSNAACITPALSLACAKAYTWLEVFVLYALLGQRLHGGDCRVQELADDFVKFVEGKVHPPIGGGESDVLSVFVSRDVVVAWAH